MAERDLTTNEGNPDHQFGAGSTALERVQRDLEQARVQLQTEVTQISQLQASLEMALETARGVRLDVLGQLDRLAEDVMGAARQDADRLRAQAQEEAERLRAQVQEEARAMQAAAEAEAAERRAAFDRRVRAAQAELDRIQSALGGAEQTLATARRALTAEVGEAAAEGPLATSPASEPPAATADVTPAAAAPAESFASANLSSLTAPPPSAMIDAPEGSSDLPPAPLESAAPAAAPREPGGMTAPALSTTATSALPGSVDSPPPALVASGGGGERSPLLLQAEQQLEARDMPAALGTFRAIIDREPEQVEPVLGRLSTLLQAPDQQPYHEEIRLLLVDAYMVQGDYDRAMSLLHEPTS